MMMTHIKFVFHKNPIPAILALVFTLSACGGDTQTNLTPTTTPTPQVTTTPLSPVPTGAPTEGANSTASNFVIWFPESLAPSDRNEVANLLNDQLNGFVSEQDIPITIEFRLRRYGDVGGILATLQSANKVAPGALPDITLVRREDLPILIQEGLTLPLEGHLSSRIMGDLFPPALQAGRFQNQLYAIPYVLEMQLLAYYPDDTHPTSWTFDNILNTETFWNFPAGRSTGLNTTVFLQYLSAGGTIAPNGILNFDRDALETVLSYYEQAYQRGLIDETMLNFASGNDYLRNLTSGELRAGVINSTAFLTASANEPPLNATSIPTDADDPLTVMSGWAWIVTAKTAEHQAIAFNFIDWMMEHARQADYAQSVNMLPSQRGALNQMTLDNATVAQFDAMLTNAILMPTDNNTGALARAIQNAFISIISGDATVQQAVESVANQFAP